MNPKADRKILNSYSLYESLIYIPLFAGFLAVSGSESTGRIRDSKAAFEAPRSSLSELPTSFGDGAQTVVVFEAEAIE